MNTTWVNRSRPRVRVFSFCRNMRRARRRESAPSTARLAVVATAATDEPHFAPVVDGNAGQRLAPRQPGTHEVSEEPGDSCREGVGSVAALVAVSIRQRHQICSPISIAPGLMRAFSTIESPLLRIACPDSPKGPWRSLTKPSRRLGIQAPSYHSVVQARQDQDRAPSPADAEAWERAGRATPAHVS